MTSNGLFEEFNRVVCGIPQGKVANYGQVALLAGHPRAARFVGHVLHGNPRPGIIPCHRVVFKDGSLAGAFVFGGSDIQRRLPEDEGPPLEKMGASACKPVSGMATASQIFRKETCRPRSKTRLRRRNNVHLAK